MTPQFHFLKVNCKKCKKPIEVKAATSCTDEWIDKLLPMATCNPCWDRMEAEHKAQERARSASITERKRAILKQRFSYAR